MPPNHASRCISSASNVSVCAFRQSEIDITFEPNEPIWTESSYKYRIEDVSSMLDRAGLQSDRSVGGKRFRTDAR